MNRRAVVLALLVAAAGAGAWWWWGIRLRQDGPPVWQGYAEADYVKVGPIQPGRLIRVAVSRGDRVRDGDLLFAQDDIADRAAREEADRQYQQARQRLANLQAAGRPTEIRQAEANLAQAQATLQRIQSDLARAESLLKGGFATAQAVDQLRAEDRAAQARVVALAAALTQIRAPIGRPEEIEAQRSAMEAAYAALEAAEWRLSQRRVEAPVAGRVADVLFREGETVVAGAPVVSLLPPGNIRVRFFVAEPFLSALHLGDRVTLACDGCPAGLTGTISFIAPEAEYTPPVIYSDTSRSKLVYLIEARPEAGQATAVNPGQPMQVRRVVAP
ncbi:MAG: HlyD family secretion protein [Acetobacteraceae bacterium]